MDKTNIKSSALSRSTRFNLDCSHITTMDFMRLQPIYYRRMIPGQKLDISVNAFSRLADMPCPTFGQARLRILGFFVPYRTVWRPFNSFISGTVDGSTRDATNFSQCAYIYNEDIVAWFLDGGFATLVSSTSDDVADFEIGDGVSEWTAGSRFKFRGVGRYYYKLLQCLGIQLDFNMPTGLCYNALDILSFLRVLIDWLYAKQEINDQRYHRIENLLTNVNQSNVTNDLLDILTNFLDVTFMPYESGYFTDLFESPQGPNNDNSNFAESVVPSDSKTIGSGVATRLPVVNTNRSNVANSAIAEGVPSITAHPNANTQTVFGVPQVTESLLQNLHALTMYVRRNNIAGSRAYERAYSMFGLKPDADVYNRSYYLGDYSVNLQVSDVMSTSSTDGASLGSYAGKGYLLDVNDSIGNFKFENDSVDFGVFMLLAYIEPKVSYPYGVDGMQLDLGRLDFYHGDFDSVGTSAVTANELFLPSLGNPSLVGSPTSDFAGQYRQIIGFTPRYSRYKTSRDWLTGDFRLESKNQAGITSKQWHFARSLFGEAPTDFVVGENLLRAIDADQYDRIFYNTDAQVDHFVCQFLFRVSSYAPMRQLYDFFEFEDDKDKKDINPEIMGISKV